MHSGVERLADIVLLIPIDQRMNNRVERAWVVSRSLRQPSTITIRTGTTVSVRSITPALSSTNGARRSISAIRHKPYGLAGVPSAAYAEEAVVMPPHASVD